MERFVTIFRAPLKHHPRAQSIYYSNLQLFGKSQNMVAIWFDSELRSGWGQQIKRGLPPYYYRNNRRLLATWYLWRPFDQGKQEPGYGFRRTSKELPNDRSIKEALIYSWATRGCVHVQERSEEGNNSHSAWSELEALYKQEVRATAVL